MSNFSPERRSLLRNMSALVASPIIQTAARETQVTTATALGIARFAFPVVAGVRAEIAYQAELLFPERYSGYLTNMEGMPYIGPEKYRRLLVTLEQTGDPLLNKVVADIRKLSSPNLSEEIPQWAAFERKPFPLTYNPKSMDSFFSHFPRSLEGSGDAVILRDSKGNSIGFNDFDKVFLGIQLANAPDIRKAGQFDEAMFLAKEVLTMTMMLRMAQEFHLLMERLGVNAVDASGNALGDPPKIQKAGEMLWFLESSDENTLTWKVIDTLPTALLAVSLTNLMNKGKFSVSKDTTIGNILLGIHLLNLNPAVRAGLQGLSTEWIRSGKLMPPAGITPQLFTHPYSTFLNMYQDEMRKRESTAVR
ncbi:hypothetical protein HYS93_02130 [Candidatus Daviesbacteria bacterium]|nr:hypothetical protein [Candidatus Daviesbacteria bacterium]